MAICIGVPCRAVINSGGRLVSNWRSLSMVGDKPVYPLDARNSRQASLSRDKILIRTRVRILPRVNGHTGKYSHLHKGGIGFSRCKFLWLPVPIVRASDRSHKCGVRCEFKVARHQAHERLIILNLNKEAVYLSDDDTWVLNSSAVLSLHMHKLDLHTK